MLFPTVKTFKNNILNRNRLPTHITDRDAFTSPEAAAAPLLPVGPVGPAQDALPVLAEGDGSVPAEVAEAAATDVARERRAEAGQALAEGGAAVRHHGVSRICTYAYNKKVVIARCPLLVFFSYLLLCGVSCASTTKDSVLRTSQLLREERRWMFASLDG